MTLWSYTNAAIHIKQDKNKTTPQPQTTRKSPSQICVSSQESKPDKTTTNRKRAGAQQKHPQPKWKCCLHSGKIHTVIGQICMKSIQTNYKVASTVEHVKQKAGQSVHSANPPLMNIYAD